MPFVSTFGSFKLLEPSGPVPACTRCALNLLVKINRGTSVIGLLLLQLNGHNMLNTYVFFAIYIPHFSVFGPPSSGRPTDINVLKLRILTNIKKIFKLQKDEIHIV